MKFCKVNAQKYQQETLASHGKYHQTSFTTVSVSGHLFVYVPN